MINDDEEMKEVQRRVERCWLACQRRIQDLDGIAELSEEDWNVLHNRCINRKHTL